MHGRTFQAFQSRFRFPAQESGSPSQLFYSFDLAGVHLLLNVVIKQASSHRKCIDIYYNPPICWSSPFTSQVRYFFVLQSV